MDFEYSDDFHPNNNPFHTFGKRSHLEELHNCRSPSTRRDQEKHPPLYGNKNLVNYALTNLALFHGEIRHVDSCSNSQNTPFDTTHIQN